MIVTKKEAKEMGLDVPYCCPFHENHPDQTAITGSCDDCIWIEDPCGCGWDEGCELCTPEEFGSR